MACHFETASAGAPGPTTAGQAAPPAKPLVAIAGSLIRQGTQADGRAYCGNPGPACRAVSAGYAAQVLAWASRYGQVSDGVGPVAAVAVRAAMSQLGTPYLWGGESPRGFDCSGLMRWAYAAAGVGLPRVAQDQYDAGPLLSADAILLPGDLVFFGAGPRAVTHVGMYIGDGRFVDAPHTGAVVRVDVLAGFTPNFVGATRPVQVTS